MKDDDVHLTFDDGTERSFERATLEIHSGQFAIKLNRNSYNMNDSSQEQDPLLNGMIGESTDAPSIKKVRPNSLALVPWSGEDANDFFCFRSGLIASAIEECKKCLICEDEEAVLGSWLLTEISFWDSEKERLVLLTEKYLYTIKYDFIALKILDQRKTALEEIDTLLIGELIYPSASIIPHLDGLASGVSSIVKGCLVRPIQERLAGMPSCTTTSHLNFREGFEARSRNLNGIRIMWSKGQPLSFLKKWNPFEKDIPFATFASHPLLWHKDEDNKESKIFNVDDFILEMKKVLHERIQILQCSLQHRPVVLENYLGVGALIHNKHSLGFFKVRGKFSF